MSAEKISRRTVCLASAMWAGGARAAATLEVTIKDMQFHPAELPIRVGDTVRWTNRERRTSHTVLFPGLESDRLLPDESWERRFGAAGRYPYVCGPHPEMRGVVIVEA